MIFRKLIGTIALTRQDRFGNPESYSFEVWIDADLIAKRMGTRALRSKNQYATAIFGGVLVKKIKV